MGTTTGFEPHLVVAPGRAAAKYQTSPRRHPAGSNEASTTRRLNLAAAIQRVQVTQRLTSQQGSSGQQAKGKVQRNHIMAGSALHLGAWDRDSKSAAYASAAYAQSQASGGHDADVAAFSAATKGRLSGIRATMKTNKRSVHAQYAAGEAVIAQSRGLGGKAEAANIYAVLDELLELAAAKDAALLEAGLRRHADTIRTCRGAVGETVLHLCFLFGSAAHKVGILAG